MQWLSWQSKAAASARWACFCVAFACSNPPQTEPFADVDCTSIADSGSEGVSDAAADFASSDAAEVSPCADVCLDFTSVADVSDILQDTLPDADAAEVTPIWVDPCPPAPLTNSLGKPTPQPGLAMLGNTCAKPGWSSPPAAADFVWTNVTKAIGASVSDIDSCLLWQDMSGDGIADLLVVQQPATAIGPRKITLLSGTGAGKFSSTVTNLDPKLMGVFPVTDCAASDLNGDGFTDLVLAGFTGVRVLYNNLDETFTDVTDIVLPKSAQGVYTNTIAFLDYDRDGDIDLYVGRTGPMNLSPGHFKCLPADEKYYQCCFGQTAPIDQKCLDGKTDKSTLYQCCSGAPDGAPNRLLRNDAKADGSNTFTDVSANSLVDDKDATLTVSVHDLDRDGWPDLFVGNDFGKLGWYRNNADGTFAYHSTDIGMRAYSHTMGSAVSDLDGDGIDDLITGDFGPPSVYKGQKDAKFVNAGNAFGTWDGTTDTVTWPMLTLDLNNDGYRDVFAGVSIQALPGKLPLSAEGEKFDDPKAAHLTLRNQGAGKKFAHGIVPWAANAEPAVPSVVAASADLDGDGDLDMAVMTYPGILSIWRNDTPGQGHWLEVQLIANKSAPNGVGAVIQVFSDGHLQERQVEPVPGFGAHGDYLLHFGMGAAKVADQVRVWWPTGCVSVIDKAAVDGPLQISEKTAICPSNALGGTADADGGSSGETADASPPSWYSANAITGLTPVDLATLPKADFMVDVTAKMGLGDFAAGFTHTKCTVGADFDGDGNDDFAVIEKAPKGGKTRIHTVLRKATGKLDVYSNFDTSVGVPANGCSLGDLDSDGKLDLLVGLNDSGMLYYQNEGAGSFVDKTVIYLPKGMDFTTWSAAVGDFDHDSDVDILVGAGASNTTCENVSCNFLLKDFSCFYSKPVPPKPSTQDRLLLRPDGKLFVDQTSNWKLPAGGEATVAATVDIDGDGWLDALIGNDFGTHYVLYNNKNKFTAYGTEIGFKAYGHIMGWGIGDFDGDGHFDLATADAGPMELYMQKSPVGSNPVAFVDEAEKWGLAGVTHDVSAWDPLVADFDQDGLEDIYLGVAAWAPLGALAPLGACAEMKNPPLITDLFFRNKGDGTFTSFTILPAESQSGSFFGIAQTAVDIDGDGDLDIIQVRREGDVRVLRNDLPANAKSSVIVRLSSKTTSTFPIGARAVATVNGKQMWRQLIGNTGFGGTGQWSLHFGLGSAKQIDKLEVWWPGVATNANNPHSTLSNIAAGTTVTLVEP